MRLIEVLRQKAYESTSVAPIDDDALVEWLRGADADGDGGISFPEFVQVAAGAQSLPARRV